MAYQPRPNYDTRSPVMEHEHRHSPWMSHEQRPQPHQQPHQQQHQHQHQHQHQQQNQHQHQHQHQHPHPHPIHATSPSPPRDVMDPESEDSDVSAVDGGFSTFAFFKGLPPAPSKQALESQQSIQARLEELEQIENQNIKTHKELKAKRARMDADIARKRAAQDKKWKAIKDSRARRDSRIKQRRDREDIAFQRFFEDHEEEDSRLRQRLRKLKRGIPIDEGSPTHRRVSVNSMSPIATPYSTVPPPAKRHQTTHPSHESPQRPPEGTMYPPHQAERPPYHFYPAPQNPAPLPPSYQTNPPPYATRPPVQSPTVPTHPRMGPATTESTPYAPNGHVPSPHTSTPTLATVNTPQPPPPRLPSTNYDTRPPPPPPVSSSFAAVNQPSHSGFAAVNARHTETPPATVSHASTSQTTVDHGQKQNSKSVDHTPIRTNATEDKMASGSSSTNKRTPSTTHPYQMSEAFANRHHHCERTDSINRGIWTWYGKGGTQDRPTGPATEMYLKCNHDGCGRIDWRTVHGLQCHIVKNHDQPKGTIGSLEKALDRYGVPVKDIEEIEKRDGLGSGGTMADPKTVKVRSRPRDPGDRSDLIGRITPVSGGAPSFGQNQYHSNGSRSPSSAPAPQRNDASGKKNSYSDHYHDSGSESTPIDVEKHSQSRPSSGFAAVNASWQTINSTPSRRPPSRDHEMHDTQRPFHPAVTRPGPARSPQNAPTPFWPPWQAKSDGPVARPHQKPPPFRSATSEVITIDDSSISVAKPFEKRDPDNTMSAPNTGEAVKAIAQEKVEEPKKEPEKAKEVDMEDKRSVVEQDTEIKDTEMTEAPSITLAAKTSATTDTQPENDIVKEEPPSAQTNEAPIYAKPTTGVSIPVVNDDKEATTTKDVKSNTEEETKPIPQSPEVSNRRISSRRESRRTSIATAASSKAGTEKGKDDEVEVISTTNKTSATESIDNEGDSITVNVDAVKAEQKEREKERLKDDDRTSTPPRRSANGRFTRRNR